MFSSWIFHSKCLRVIISLIFYGILLTGWSQLFVAIHKFILLISLFDSRKKWQFRLLEGSRHYLYSYQHLHLSDIESFRKSDFVNNTHSSNASDPESVLIYLHCSLLMHLWPWHVTFSSVDEEQSGYAPVPTALHSAFSVGAHFFPMRVSSIPFFFNWLFQWTSTVQQLLFRCYNCWSCSSYHSNTSSISSLQILIP